MSGYRAFISYAHADERVAGWLHRALESYRLPADIAAGRGLADRRLTPIFRDREEMASSRDLSGAIREALQSSAALIVVCSPAAHGSQWVNEEVRQFAAMHGREDIFCLIVAGDPRSAQAQCLPVALQEVLGAEPLAADVRPGKDGRSLARLKIVAGLLGIRLDDLRQRESQRRLRRVSIVAGASLAGMTIAVALAVYANTQRIRAEDEHARAEQEAAQALAINAYLQRIIETPDPLFGEGRSITVEEALTASESYLSETFPNQPQWEVEALRLIGRMYTSTAKYQDAQRVLSRAHELQRNIEAEPILRSEVLNDLARLEQELGQLDTAERHFDEAHELALAAGETAGAAAILNNLGLLYFHTNRLSRAEAVLTESLEIKRGVLPANSPELPPALNNLGLVLLELRRFDEAIALFDEALAGNTAIFGAEHAVIGVNLNNLGEASLQRGELETAESYFEQAIAVKTATLDAQHPSTAISVQNLARLRVVQGRFTEAQALIEQALADFISAYQPQHWRVAYAEGTLGTVYLGFEQYERAEQMLDSTLQTLTRELGGEHAKTREIAAAKKRIPEWRPVAAEDLQ